MSKRKTNTEFIEESKKIFGDKYDYTLLNYIKNNIKVKLICPIHGEFQVRPNDHFNKHVGCTKCNNAGLVKKNNSSINLIDKFKLIHGEKYDYSLVEYNGNNVNIKILCPEHGIFKQLPKHHLTGSSCPECKNVKKLTNETFINKSKLKHLGKYDYSFVEYKNNNTAVKILCKSHGVFKQTPNAHLSGSGCPICRESKGEQKINNFLVERGYNFIRQKRFNECRDILPLPFDFYLPEFNICIEFDGELHFKSKKAFGGDIKLFDRQKKDNIKNKYCMMNNISLIRVKYDDNILDVLEKALRKLRHNASKR
jgi:very-short-patch-repair endonuclease